MDKIEIKPGYLGATPPNKWYEKLICKAIQAKTWHWLLFIRKDSKGWIITESINKGVALTRCDYPQVRIYKIKGLEVIPKRLIGLVADYGASPYDFQINLVTAIWFLLRHYFGFALPIIKDRSFNCQEWVVCLCAELGIEVLPPEEYPYSINLENSKKLEYVGGICQ